MCEIRPKTTQQFGFSRFSNEEGCIGLVCLDFEYMWLNILDLSDKPRKPCNNPDRRGNVS